MIYKTKGTCSSAIEFEIENGILTDVKFQGGCMGNTAGVAALAIGRPIDEVIEKLSGIPCGFRGTSCPDQLSRALKLYKEEHPSGGAA
ncbi:TIGR03905 family TSCPD domain-containing protein [Anaerostipes sp. MSJ-23]|uniref:TIGR03905 family TSCPD domain-containing protein n=1 Tax=unclassified Anaerostipes TaxID=2635253 RepID=UPI001C0F4DC5|nr:TIGR03905 family TSCPD domain-containing protein [Anaerostipes sp. MSJ-23]MBU5460710.1 TIGR03905 family TSCPD domain-containing protein [Anaerostipes sp. MSJ-23]